MLHALHEYAVFYNTHRPHQGIANARPLTLLPEPITDPDRPSPLDVGAELSLMPGRTRQVVAAELVAVRGAELTLELPGRTFLLQSDQAALELGTRDPHHGVPMLA